MSSKHDRLKEHLKKLREELPFLARHALKIRDKAGSIVPLEFNKVQTYIHAKLEEQKKLTGKVRAIILKGRQQGSTTYVSARFYHKTSTIPGTTTFILSHQAKTTGPLFDIVKRFHQNAHPSITPDTDAANKNQLKFNDLNAEYTVGTAGNEDVGRGLTIKQLHLSEVAWYERTDNLETGLMQAVADLPDTEIIMESTANGMNNMFYRMCMDALKGLTEYILIFVPWFWQTEYRTKVPENFQLSAEEGKIKAVYNLDNEQIYWRRLKIASFGEEGEWKFKQEYPMNPMEAFVVSGQSFLSQQLLMAARKNHVDTSPAIPKICGMDCARTNDRIVITCRQGRKVLWWKKFIPKDLPPDPTPYLADQVMAIIDQHGINKFFVDWAQGYGIIDLCRSQGYQQIVQGVNFGQKASNPEVYANKRAEMGFSARDWLEEGSSQIPDDDEFFADLASVPQAPPTASSEKLRLVPKADIKKKNGQSPDVFDSFILTFAFPVHTDIIKLRSASRTIGRAAEKKSEISTLNRMKQANQASGRTATKILVDH